jgi:outer membrane protein assembly factor BamD
MATAEKGLANMKKVLALSKMTLADYYFKYRHNYQGAKVFYNEAITVYPDSAVAAQARAKLVLVEAKLEQQAKLPVKKAPPPVIKKKKKLWLF